MRGLDLPGFTDALAQSQFGLNLTDGLHGTMLSPLSLDGSVSYRR